MAAPGVLGNDNDIERDPLSAALLTHRIHISPQTRLRGRTPRQIVADITEQVPVPVNE